MAYRQLESLDRSRNRIAKELHKNPKTVNDDIIDTDLFINIFGLNKYQSAIRHKKQWKINLGIYHTVKICVHYFKELKNLADKYEKKQNITASEIINQYNNNFLKDIDLLRKSPDGEHFIAQILCNHPSVKYACVMAKYYELFLNDISLIASMCTDASIIENVFVFDRMLSHLEEVIWLYNCEKKVNRTQINPGQFDITRALNDTIQQMDNINDSCEIKDIQEKLQDLSEVSEQEYKKSFKALENEYFETAQRMLQNEKDTIRSREFYTTLTEERSFFNDSYTMTYKSNFIAYAILSYEEKLRVLKNFLQLTDIYGRMLVPSLIDSIDKREECISKYINILKNKNYRNLEDFYNNEGKLIKDAFYAIYFEENEYIVDDSIKPLGYDSKKIISEAFNLYNDNDIAQMEKILFAFSEFWLSKQTVAPDKLVEDNLNYIYHYLRYCSGLNTFFEYNGYINVVYSDIEKTKKDTAYGDIKNDIDSAIARKWTKEMFGDIINTSN